MTKITKSIEIEASPEKVFAFMCDLEKMNEITKGSRALNQYCQTNLKP